MEGSGMEMKLWFILLKKLNYIACYMGKLKGYKMREIQRKNKEASTADVKS